MLLVVEMMIYEACPFRANSTSVTLSGAVTQAHPARTGRGLTKLQTGWQFADFTSNGLGSLTNMLTTSRLLLGLGPISMLTHSWFGAISRRGCSASNCAWNNWSGWGACNHPRGNAGEQVRSRNKRWGPTAAVEDAPAARPTIKHATDFATTEAPRDPDIAHVQTSSGALVVDTVSIMFL